MKPENEFVTPTTWAKQSILIFHCKEAMINVTIASDVMISGAGLWNWVTSPKGNLRSAWMECK